MRQYYETLADVGVGVFGERVVDVDVRDEEDDVGEVFNHGGGDGSVIGIDVEGSN